MRYFCFCEANTKYYFIVMADSLYTAEKIANQISADIAAGAEQYSDLFFIEEISSKQIQKCWLDFYDITDMRF